MKLKLTLMDCVVIYALVTHICYILVYKCLNDLYLHVPYFVTLVLGVSKGVLQMFQVFLSYIIISPAKNELMSRVNYGQTMGGVTSGRIERRNSFSLDHKFML